MAEALTTLSRLLIVREIQEDASGAALHFHGEGHGRLALRDANYATHLRLARRSHERQHPVGVGFGEGHTITELIRADNDVPTKVWEEDVDCARVLFQGHDGVSISNWTIRSPLTSAPCWPRRSGRRAGCGSSLRSPTWRCWTSCQPDGSGIPW